jgi:glutamine amidotransferase-like uncharacterized protein
LKRTSQKIVLLLLLIVTVKPTLAAPHHVSELSMKIPSGEYIVIPPQFKYYRMINALLYQKVSGYRLLADLASLNLHKGDFLFPIDHNQPNDIPQILNRLSVTFDRRTISDHLEAPGVIILKPLKIGIYCGKGVTAGHLWHFFPMEKCLFDVVFLKETDIGAIKDVDVICFPSGGRYQDFIPGAGQKHLKKLIWEQGMGFLGTCGGNVFGAQLSLLDAMLIKRENGNPFGVAVNGFPRMAVEQPDHPAMVTASSTMQPFYYWGQVFRHVGPDAEVLATYQDLNGTFRFDGSPYDGDDWKKMTGLPAVISGKYGRGPVILSGVHPEMGEEQIFMDWIYYLAAGSMEEKRMTAAEPLDPSTSRRSMLRDLLSAVEAFETLAAPYASQIIPYWKSRWNENITIGLPVLMIFSDLWNRLAKLKKAATDLLKSPGKEAIPIEILHIRRLEVARIAFSGMIPDLEKTLKMLREKDRISPNVRKNMSTERSFYPEYYFDLVENIKSVHLPLVEIDYLFQRLEIKTAVNDRICEKPGTAFDINPFCNH